GEGAGTRYDADLAPLVDVAGHDPDLALPRGDHTGAVRADEPGVGALEVPLGDDHVGDRDPLGDGDHQLAAGGSGLRDGVAGGGGRDVDHRHGGPGLLDRLPDRGVHREIDFVGVGSAGYARVIGLALESEGLTGA